MNGSTEYRAQGASEKPGRRQVVLTLATVRSMLPLVQRIVDDIVKEHRHLAQLRPEESRLNRQRRLLSWPERCRRYQIQDELAAAECNLQEAVAELATLGVVLFDAGEGRVGFPTKVNNRRAYFSWRFGEDGVNSWHFPDDTARRPIPTSWAKSTESGMMAKTGGAVSR